MRYRAHIARCELPPRDIHGPYRVHASRVWLFLSPQREAENPIWRARFSVDADGLSFFENRIPCAVVCLEVYFVNGWEAREHPGPDLVDGLLNTSGFER